MARPGQKSCDGCGEREARYTTPYWDERKGFCSRCCFEQNAKFDAEGWPDPPELPNVEGATHRLVPVYTRESSPRQEELA